jgi:ActR/RegA family two-component response regulator
MTANEFNDSTLSQLENLTSINRFRWSKYFNGKMSMREDILCRTASELGMSPGTLLEILMLRRDSNLSHKNVA